MGTLKQALLKAKVVTDEDVERVKRQERIAKEQARKEQAKAAWEKIGQSERAKKEFRRRVRKLVQPIVEQCVNQAWGPAEQGSIHWHMRNEIIEAYTELELDRLERMRGKGATKES